MKTSFLKLFIPVLLFGVAVAGAFATNSQTSSDSLTHQEGFVKVNPLGTLCDNPEMCTTVSGEICTVGNVSSGAQLWGKNQNNRCVVELYRIQ